MLGSPAGAPTVARMTERDQVARVEATTRIDNDVDLMMDIDRGNLPALTRAVLAERMQSQVCGAESLPGGVIPTRR